MMLYLEYLSQGLEQGEQEDHLSKYLAKPKHGNPGGLLTTLASADADDAPNAWGA